jgi:segregation and condensation protein B
MLDAAQNHEAQPRNPESSNVSLKAKIEAVIYASEDPVTLAQLVGLLGHEAQAELDCDADTQQALSLNETEALLETAAEADPSLLPDTPPEPSAADADAAPPTEPTAARAEKARAALLRTHFRAVLDVLIAEYASSDRGLEIREVAGGFRFATKPEYHDAVRGFVRSLKPPFKLTLQALETLAVVAYKQPVTAPEISEIRGVDSSGVLGSLISRKLITTAGRKHVIGRPILYKTTREFLLRFGLKDIAELPSIEEFETMAGQMAEQEDIPMSGEASNTSETPETEEARLESDGDAPPPEPLADEIIVDGRLSGLPPVYDDAADDPSAAEGAIQSSETLTESQTASGDDPVETPKTEAKPHHKPSLIEEVIDEISHGTLLP